MAGKKLFIGCKVGVENVGFAIAGGEEEFCGGDQENLSHYYHMYHRSRRKEYGHDGSQENTEREECS